MVQTTLSQSFLVTGRLIKGAGIVALGALCLFPCLGYRPEEKPTSEEIEKLIKQLDDPELINRNAAEGWLLKSWEYYEVRAAVAEAFSKAKLDNNEAKAKRLESLLVRIDCRQLLGRRVVDTIQGDIDKILCEGQEGTVLGLFASWMNDPVRFGFEDDKRRAELAEWVYAKLKSPGAKNRFIDFYKNYKKIEEGKKWIAKMLDDFQALVRAHAATTLSELGAAEYSGKVAELLEDDSDKVREAAINAIDKLGPEDYITTIAKMLSDTSAAIRIRATQILAAGGHRKYADKIAILLSDTESTVRVAAIIALGDLGETKAAPKIAELLKDDNSYVKEAAIRELGKMGEKKFAKKIAEFLKDNNLELRAAAIVALGRIGDTAYLRQIHGFLKDRVSTIRANASIALVDLADPVYIKDIQKLTNDTAACSIYDDNMRGWAKDTVGNVANRLITQYLNEMKQLLNDPDPAVIVTAMFALGELQDRSAVGMIAARLQDRNPDVRASAAAWIGKYGNKNQEQALAQLLEDASPCNAYNFDRGDWTSTKVNLVVYQIFSDWGVDPKKYQKKPPPK